MAPVLRALALLLSVALLVGSCDDVERIDADDLRPPGGWRFLPTDEEQPEQPPAEPPAGEPPAEEAPAEGPLGDMPPAGPNAGAPEKMAPWLADAVGLQQRVLDALAAPGASATPASPRATVARVATALLELERLVAGAVLYEPPELEDQAERAVKLIAEQRALGGDVLMGADELALPAYDDLIRLGEEAMAHLEEAQRLLAAMGGAG